MFDSTHVGQLGDFRNIISVEGMPHSFSLQPLSKFVVYDALISTDVKTSTREDKMDPSYIINSYSSKCLENGS